MELLMTDQQKQIDAEQKWIKHILQAISINAQKIAHPTISEFERIDDFGEVVVEYGLPRLPFIQTANETITGNLFVFLYKMLSSKS
jgi:hypothetical protein